ncbi:hypothetical protein FA13DRAFT_963277 [Coprinellus micaceus]|uniref:Ig-like domain-containing protein n=1 Tax=Coprinellus micaceus TaxID=71717 RepID=A0A4Y7RWY8_COPMI|nr:hypothetical protein FA13DRAFT_963277 [Coprinellus micaceus]
MKFSATTSYSLLAFTAFVLAKEVTLYHPVVTRSSGASYYSLTGDLTVKPISTATDGRTAYEVQQTITGLEEGDSRTYTTSVSPTATTYVFLADETQYERVETLTASGLPGLVTINDLKCTKDDDGTMVCQVEGETRYNATSTAYGSLPPWIAVAEPLYTLTVPDSGATAVTLSGSMSLMGVLTSVGFAAGLLLV